MTIIWKAVRGQSLRGHQSDMVKHANFHDYLLNDWGINHLHLGCEPDRNKRRKKRGFLQRTGPLLFVAHHQDQLFLVDVLDHGSFEDIRLLDLVHQHFPAALARYRMDNVVGLESEISATERALLRKNGVQCPTKVSDGTVYLAPGGGITTSGLSASARIWADHFLRSYADVETLQRLITVSGGTIPPVFSAVRFDLGEDLSVRAVQFLPPLRSCSVPVPFVLDHVPTKRSA